MFEEKEVNQPLAVQRYNQYMNAVDRSDQILSNYTVSRKCYKWWKTLFFHLIDMAIVNGFILFQKHRANNPDSPALKRRSTYSMVHFREEIVRQICGLEEYDVPPANGTVQPGGQFVAVHVPKTAEGTIRRNCVVCYSLIRKEKKVRTYCSAPQCSGRFMHIGGKSNCFETWHSESYTGRR